MSSTYQELLTLSAGLLKLYPNPTLAGHTDRLRQEMFRSSGHGGNFGYAPETEQLALARALQTYARQKRDQTYMDRLSALQSTLAQRLRHEYERIVPETGCGCSAPRPMFDLDGNPLCQCCGRFLPEETRLPNSRVRHADPHRSQVEYFDSLLDNLEGAEGCAFEPAHLERVRTAIERELDPSRRKVLITASYLREKLKSEQLSQYYPHLIRLYRELVGGLPYQQPEGFRTKMRKAFRVLLEVQAEHCPNARRNYPFILHNLLRTLYPNNIEIEKLRSFHQFDERTISAEQVRQWGLIREPFLKRIRLENI